MLTDVFSSRLRAGEFFPLYAGIKKTFKIKPGHSNFVRLVYTNGRVHDLEYTLHQKMF
jgi:hypothetical protein